MTDKIQDPVTNPLDRSGIDKMDLHYRQQLSALIDGALAPDEARFLLRRMQHDLELAECWERWQVAGEVMRGRATAVLPAGFAMRVGAAIAAGTGPADAASARQQSRWLRWGGGAALAASVAVVALLMARQAPDIEAPVQPGSAIVAATPSFPVDSQLSGPVPAVTSAQAGSARADSGQANPAQSEPAQALAGAAVASVAVADAPRRAVQRTRSSPQRPRGQAPRPLAVDAARMDVAAASTSPSAAASHPFATGAPPASRPWPRPVLPQFGGSGALTADANASPSFYPFQPRLPDDGTQPDAAPATPR